MRYIPSSFDIPYYNMELEEYLLENTRFTDDYLVFYVHKPSVIIGAHQNAYKEINARYIGENGVIVARRLSGGGAVYHDGGNLNYSFVFSKPESVRFDKLLAPVCEALNSLGAGCAFTGRNDLTIDGRKFGGAAQCIKNGRLLFHGTLMVDVDFNALSQALTPDKMKIASKGIDSVRSRVVNLKEKLGPDVGVDTLKDHLLRALMGNSPDVTTLTEDDLAAVREKVARKFSLASHNYGFRYDFGMEKSVRCEAGGVSVRILTDGAVIRRAVFSGDFFVTGDLSLTERALCGAALTKEGILNAVPDTRIAGFTPEALAELILY
jgi:lipoate-protein ligase A